MKERFFVTNTPVHINSLDIVPRFEVFPHQTQQAASFLFSSPSNNQRRYLNQSEGRSGSLDWPIETIGRRERERERKREKKVCSRNYLGGGRASERTELRRENESTFSSFQLSPLFMAKMVSFNTVVGILIGIHSDNESMNCS